MNLGKGVRLYLANGETYKTYKDTITKEDAIQAEYDKLKGKEYDPFMLLGDVLRWIELEPTVLEASEGRKK